MRLKIILLTTSLFIFLKAEAQDIQAYFETSFSGNSYIVEVYLKNTGNNVITAGTSSLVFNYNAAALSNPVFTPGEFDFSVSPLAYYPQEMIPYGEGAIGIEINPFMKDAGEATAVSSTGTLAGTITFQIINPSQDADILWNTEFSAIYDANLDELITKAVFIDPTTQALPVELVSFKAKAVNNTVELEWVTASEINNHFFNVERLSGNGEWVKLETIFGNGTTSTSSKYNYVDQHPLNGINYYRLRQVDYDGTQDFSHVLRVNFAGQKLQVKAYPIPVKNGTLNLANVIEQAQISVYGMDGRKVHSETISTDGEINLQKLSSGVYLLEIISGSEYQRIKLLVD